MLATVFMQESFPLVLQQRSSKTEVEFNSLLVVHIYFPPFISMNGGPFPNDQPCLISTHPIKPQWVFPWISGRARLMRRSSDVGLKIELNTHVGTGW